MLYFRKELLQKSNFQLTSKDSIFVLDQKTQILDVQLQEDSKFRISSFQNFKFPISKTYNAGNSNKRSKASKMQGFKQGCILNPKNKTMMTLAFWGNES